MSGSKVLWNGNKMCLSYFLKIFSYSEENGFSGFTLDSKNVKNFLYFLAKSEDFLALSLMDMWIVDNLKFYQIERFQINYLLYSHVYHRRWFIRVAFSNNVTLESLVALFPSANWLEREAWDLYGIFFKGHTDLRRILTDYGFLGHPMLKDFPLTGYFELRFDLNKKRVIQEGLKLVQEYRYFDFSTPWI